MDTEIQATPPYENGSKIEESSSESPSSETVTTNGKDPTPKTPPTVLTVRATRSRSRTPQKKKEKKVEETAKSPLKKIEETVNGHEEKKTNGDDKKATKAVEEVTDDAKNGTDEIKEDETKPKEKKKSPKKAVKVQEQSSSLNGDSKEKAAEIVEAETFSKLTDHDAVEMDPLIIGADEPDPELQFDDTSDMDSGKGSPVIQSRCKTRRSHNRNAPTPKTPKSVTDSESEKNSVAPTPTPENLTDTNDSLNVEDTSTRAEAGSDSTRLDFTNNDVSVFSEDNSYLNYSRERSLSETLRSLTSRKTIHPLNDSYRLRAFRNNQNKSQLNQPNSIERVISLKRKRSATPEERKKFKSSETGGSGFVSYFSNPLAGLKSRFIDGNSSTPKLTGYKDSNHEEGTFSEVVVEETDKKGRCIVM